MPTFPHLKLPIRVEGQHIFSGGGGSKLPTSIENLAQRRTHGRTLKRSLETITNNWQRIIEEKTAEGINIPNSNQIPIFFQIDTNAFDVETLEFWGVDLISEEEDGFFIGSSIDGLESFKAKVEEFIENNATRYKDKAAQIWEVVTDDNVRINRIISGGLKEIWNNLQEEIEYVVELGISCSVPNKLKYPLEQNFDDREKFNESVDKFLNDERNIHILRDQKQIERENEIEQYREIYNATILDIWDNEVDAIFFKLRINGKGLRDLITTCQHVYSATFSPEFNISETQSLGPFESNVVIIGPEPEAPSVCVIDSGIQEGHLLIAPAINSLESKCYIENVNSTADQVRLTGHGTSVAGAILYPKEIPKTGNYNLDIRLINARILDDNNFIPKDKFCTTLINNIVQDYPSTKIFNLSVAEYASYLGTHMPETAAGLDKISHDNEVLFVVSSGNIREIEIKEHLDNGRPYPSYCVLDGSKISNPGVSAFALTVGSVGIKSHETDDYISFGNKEHISSFSRTGFGLWEMIKPDVVEYGGDFLRHKRTNELINHQDTTPELIQSTIHGAPPFGKSSLGTSFCTPKVSHIAAKLQKELPNEKPLLYKALIVQSAKLPEHCRNNPELNDFKYYGYGIPNLEDALENSERRITFITSGNIAAKKADIYPINIPEQLRGEGKNFKLLVEVTLAFTAKTRLTRKKTHSYLSTWLEWKSSHYNESFDNFRSKTIKYLELEGETSVEVPEPTDNPIQWTIRENSAWGKIKNITRNNSAVQKDWCIIEPNQFAETFNLAVIGHAGWDKNLKNTIPYSLCVSFEVVGAEIDIYTLIKEAQIPIEVPIEEEVRI